ncbi:glycosyltransferase family 2 protein [Candidatus Pacearchaeota archaeon]|nr:glycosyltransferase family 2 protein [Candidatus Pacearchaeota archaeon]
MGKVKLSIIVPMYNSVDIIQDLREVSSIIKKITPNYEIIVINDGSKNDCFQEAKKIKNKKIKIYGYKKNQGKGNAIKYGFNFVKGDYVAFLDSGRDLDPNQLRKFFKIMEEEKADIVIGSKKHKESKVFYPISRRIMSGVYQILNKLLFNLNVRDTQVGIKLFKKKALDKIMPKIVIKRFAFDLELLVLANKYGFKIVEAPIILEYKFKSTINIRSVFWILWDTAAIFYRLKILKWYDRH